MFNLDNIPSDPVYIVTPAKKEKQLDKIKILRRNERGQNRAFYKRKFLHL